MQKLGGADINCDSNWLGAKMVIVLKIVKFQKGKPRLKVENLYVLRKKANKFVEAIFLGSNVELGM